MRLELPQKAVLIVCAITLITSTTALIWAHMMRSQAQPEPSPTSDTPVETMAERQGWPDVDWEHWLSVNPGICAWITVPGTDVDHPIVQASADAPSWYLKHDLYGNWNPWGSVYLDAECAERGILSSRVVWIYGHNMLDGSMFEPLTQYADAEFMAEHPKVWIQTPSGAMRSYDVYAAEVVQGAERVRRVDFKDQADFESWRDTRYQEATAVREGLSPLAADRVLCLVTCSHNTFKNERTVVYCMASQDARRWTDAA